MKKKLKLSFIILVFIIISVFVSFFLTTFVHLYKDYIQYEKTTKNLLTEFEHDQKQLITKEVCDAVALINKEKQKLIDDTKLRIKVRVDTIFGIINNLYKESEGKVTSIEFKKKLEKILFPLEFNDQLRNYFIADLNGVEILYPNKKEWEGKNLLNFKSFDNKYIVKEMIDLVKTKKEGYLYYKWNKGKINGVSENLDYIAYVKLFKPLNWYIGLGTDCKNEEDILKKNLIKQLSKIRYGKNGLGYLFVNSFKGVDLIGELLNGKDKANNNWEIKDINGIKVVQEERKAAEKENGDYIHYTWLNPKTHQNGKKIAYIKGIKDWKWMVGAGIYLNDIEEDLNIMAATYRKKMVINALQTLLFSILIILMLIPLIIIIQRMLNEEFTKFIELFDIALSSGNPIDKSKIRFSEIEKLSVDVNEILQEKLKSEIKLEESEEKYRSLFESATDAVLLVGQRMKILDANNTMLKMFHLDSKDEALQLTIRDDLSAPDAPVDKLKELWVEVMKGEELVFEWKAMRPKEKSYFDTLVSLKKASLGESDLVIATVKDITKQKRIEEELLKIRKLESLGVLAGGIAHDFNNLLSGIFGHISIIKIKTDKNEKIYKNVIAVEGAMERAVDLTRQLLTFSKGGSPIKEIIDIKNLISESAEFSMRGSNIKLVTNIAENLKLAKVDKGQLTQVISNLVINGCQAMENGGEITISAENFDNINFKKHTLSEGMFIKIQIKDSGCGIGKENLKKIFDPYFTTKKTGSGLGLASCFSIIKKHNGLIEVLSETGRGSIFTVFIEAIDDKLIKGVLSSHKDEKDNAEVSKNEKTFNILVMDDEEYILEMLSEMIDVLGHNCDTVSDGDKAIVKFQESLKKNQMYDLVILDLTVPGGVGGEEAIKKLLKLKKNIKVIVSSGYSNDTVMAHYKEYGFCAVIKKPYTIKKLEETINSCLA